MILFAKHRLVLKKKKRKEKLKKNNKKKVTECCVARPFLTLDWLCMAMVAARAPALPSSSWGVSILSLGTSQGHLMVTRKRMLSGEVGGEGTQRTGDLRR